MNASTASPYSVRSLALDCDTRTFWKGGRRATWLLFIAGPFCPWPPRVDALPRLQRLADSASAQLGLPVYLRRDAAAGAFELVVVIDRQTKDRLISQEYRRVTESAP